MELVQAQQELDAVRLGDAARGRVSIAVEEAAEGRWIAEIVVDGEDRVVERQLEGERCADVSAGAVIVAAGALDEIAGAEPDPPTPAPTPAPAPALTPAPTSTTPTPPPRWTPTLEVFAEGGLAVGLLPGATGWAGGGLGLQGTRLRLEVGGQGSVGRTAAHPDRASVQARVSVASGWVSGCWTLGRQRPAFEAPLCAGLEAGAMTARGSGLTERGTTRAAWLAALPSARIRWRPQPWLAVGVSVAVPVALRRLAFSADDLAGAVATSRVVDLRVGPTIAIDLPPRKPRRAEKNGS